MGAAALYVNVAVLVGFCCYGVVAQLSRDFYMNTCPNVERIVRNVVAQKLKEAPTSAPGALRLFFHDCFVEFKRLGDPQVALILAEIRQRHSRDLSTATLPEHRTIDRQHRQFQNLHQGCDASVLIASSDDNVAEKDADINLSLPGDGFDVFIRAKRALESQCPNVVSCADVMAIATRDLVSMVGGPSWEVLKGRRDGLISKASRVAGNLPTVNMTVEQLISLFHSKGLSQVDLVTLSGAHTIGFSHCNEFMYRLYNYSKTSDIDPTMNPSYARSLQGICPHYALDPTVVAFNDVSTPTTFDNAYYQNAMRGLGLLETDQILYVDPRTRGYVNAFAKSRQSFFNNFVASMIKLGNVGVKTGKQGEIRRDCASFNNYN